MKIAIPTTDKKVISGQTGRAEYFMVITLEDEKVIHTEYRKNPGAAPEFHLEVEKLNVAEEDQGGGCGCGNGNGQGHENDHGHGGGGGCCGSGGHGQEVDEAHLGIAKSFADCEYVVLKELGSKLTTPLQRYDIRPVMIRGEALVNIDDIINEFMSFSKANKEAV